MQPLTSRHCIPVQRTRGFIPALLGERKTQPVMDLRLKRLPRERLAVNADVALGAVLSGNDAVCRDFAIANQWAVEEMTRLNR